MSETRGGEVMGPEERRRWAVETAARVFPEIEAGADFVRFADEIREFAESGNLPKEEEGAKREE